MDFDSISTKVSMVIGVKHGQVVLVTFPFLLQHEVVGFSLYYQNCDCQHNSYQWFCIISQALPMHDYCTATREGWSCDTG